MNKFIQRITLLIALIPSLIVPASAQSRIDFPGSGQIATQEWVQEYLFTQLERYKISDCNMSVTGVLKSGNSLEFGIVTNYIEATNYTIRITQGDQSRYWNGIPYTAGQKIVINNVPAWANARISVRPTSRPTCYYSFLFDLSTGTTIPTDPDPTDPDPTDPGTLQPCPAGPTLLGVNVISNTNITGQFHGNGVTKIDWQILTKSPVTLVRQGQATPTSAYVNLSFLPIDNGNYTLRFSGVYCTGTSDMDFTVTTSAPLPTDPDPDPQPIPDPETPDDPDNVSPVLYTHGLLQFFAVNITGTSKNWVINETTDQPLDADKTWWYFINGDIVKTRDKLVNYPYQSNAPLRLMKMALKTSYNSFNKWPGQGQATGGYYDNDAGYSFPYNQSALILQYIFR